MPEPASAADRALVEAVTLALTGVGLPAAADASASTDGLIEWLAQHEWDADRLASHRARQHQLGEPWPHAVPGPLLVAAGPARWQAVLRDVRSRLGVSGLVATAKDPDARTGPAEIRLLREVPPHHGSVG